MPSDKNNQENTPRSNLSLTLKRHIREAVESEIFSTHPQFFRCTNHLGEYRWLTGYEIHQQHEYYPHHDSLFEKLGNTFRAKRKFSIPDTPEVKEYKQILKQKILQEIDFRLQQERDIKESAQKKQRSRNESLDRREKDESFRRSHPDYNLYENHLGERRWLSKAEFESQDEFTLEVLPLGKKIFNYAKWVLPMLILISAGYYFLKPVLYKPSEKGYLLVQSNENLGHLFINQQLKLGVILDNPIVLRQGKYQVSYRKAGFSTYPAFQQIKIQAGDTSKIVFTLTAQKAEEISTVKIKSPYPDAKVFVENNFYGLAKDNASLTLEPGKYRIALKKENFDVYPPFKDILLQKGEQIELTFEFSPRSSTKVRNLDDNLGLVEITANVPNIKIYVDGKYSGYNTDHIFDKVQYGQHTVSVKKEGYTVEPEEKFFRITKLNPQQHIHFILQREAIEVSINTTPVAGKIYLDETEIGSGNWKGELKPGNYQLRFGAINSYYTPEPTTIKVDEGKATLFTFTYSPYFSILFSPVGISPKKETGSIQLGWTNEDSEFHSDPNNAPEILIPEQLGKKAWVLGYAFAYRNPPENDAIVFSFNLPSNIDLKNNIWLKMWGYRTDENYPMEFNSVNEIRIIVNNRMIQKDYTPRYSIEESGESQYERFRINNLLQPGKNTILISTGPLNTTYFALWKIAVE